MGKFFFDQYFVLHFASGIIAYFFGIKFHVWFGIHVLFEVIENTNAGIYFINTYLKIWPGGKPEADYYINRLGDQTGAMLGWVFAYFVDRYFGDRYKLNTI